MTDAAVLVTRPEDQAADLRELLAARGIPTVAVPTVAIDRESAAADLDAMLGSLDDAAWLVITSANGADALRARMTGTRTRLPNSLRVAAVGPATAEALTLAGFAVDHVPDTYLTVAIAEGLGDVAGRRVVLARADAATSDLHAALVARGALVEEVVAYRTVEAPEASREPLAAALRDRLAGVTFTSSSTVRGLVALAKPLDSARVRTLPAWCIGPVTAATARESGFAVAGIARVHTAHGLAETIHHGLRAGRADHAAPGGHR
jgi:uroporphyrinogen III methyltransferase/synthase